MKYIKEMKIFQSKTKRLKILLDLKDYIVYLSIELNTLYILKIISIEEEEDKLLNKDDYVLISKTLYKYNAVMESMKSHNISNNYSNMKKRILFKSNSLQECLDITPSLLNTNKYNL